MGKRGARNIRRELIENIRDATRQSVIFKYNTNNPK